MTSCVAKGKKYVNEAIARYVEWGDLCWKPSNKAIWIGADRCVSQSQDIFEAFDFVATNFDEITWVQVKSDESDCSKARKLIDDLPMPKGTLRVVLMRVKGKPGTFKRWRKVYGDVWIADGVV